ncbi:hypothetical protein H4R20_004071 [Coemansia guatemalensis]|uniref:AAA+ ATPase domain-containing protein n=1 Tax=Coemansia guatemalensis TaxID=2761395 RepID=A0A9W8LT46_9FUNG|nr:hypothetical protein H4R20_004071 [Coemansia guatemalensis]
MDSVAPSNRSARVLGAMPQAATSASSASKKEVEALPLFARVGVPPPARAALLAAIDMRSPMKTRSDGAGTDKRVIVGSLRQSMVANQCLERNARVIRNICLLYRISGLELDSTESDYFKRMSGDASFEAEEGKDSTLVFHRQSMYSEMNTQVLARQRQHHGGGWYLDHRPLAAMLLTMPDDVARRYFFAETFLHRWISLAHALAVRENLDLKALRGDPTLLTKVGTTAVLGSRHLRMAWSQLLESFVALRQGMLSHTSVKAGEVDAAGDIQDGGNLYAEQTENDGAEVFSLHRRVDFDEAGIGRRTEDIMDIDPDIPRPKRSVGKDAKEADSVEPLDAQQQRFTQWSDIAHKLEPIDDDYGEGEDSGVSGGTRGAIVHSPQRRIQLARKGLSDYEQRLMGSVVDPQTIPTGFSQVCVKDETVTTLQEIITLPMLRPEYFSKGVLRRYGVSGILLFGPPGTGKTMLAKAVAKESGSVVLNIRASDIYDKYVGEGEKLAEAVFTLARKLAPCVIFIDEVDALFSARSSGEPNKFRRDIMNQIMSEWDGLNTSRKAGAADKSGTAPQVMVMAATNRPFDLDDAILRRLPRRILVDLPGEDDRAKILAVHLKGEELDSDVDLKALAKRSESFSGSDLKNLCVAAAQAALRERVRAEVAASSDSADEVKDKAASGSNAQDVLSVTLIEQLKKVRRLQTAAGKPQGSGETIKLASRHFDAALKKVSPSSSDQMESLVELRKWDKIYGDGAQERKRKFHSIGFANAPPRAEEAG